MTWKEFQYETYHRGKPLVGHLAIVLENEVRNDMAMEARVQAGWMLVSLKFPAVKPCQS
jgi:hypothetical protein